MKTEQKIAFITDALPSLGGGEKTLFAALEAFPRAELFTLVYNSAAFQRTPLAQRKVHASFLDSIPLARRHHRLFLPLMPAAVERFDLRAYDLVVSFHYAVANGARTATGASHLSYTYTPLRYAWRNLNLNGRRAQKGRLAQALWQGFRIWDSAAAARLDQLAVISRAIQERVRRAYQREGRIIYPPVETERFHPYRKREDYFVSVSRLVALKRLDILVEAFSRLRLPLIVVGNGPELPRLKAAASSNIRFLGYQSDETVADLLGKARGFVSAAEEDFGIAIVEAQAAGCPVIAYGKGGSLETVLEGKTGIFFAEQTAESLSGALEKFERLASGFRPEDPIQNSRRFSKENFKREFSAFVESRSLK